MPSARMTTSIVACVAIAGACVSIWRTSRAVSADRSEFVMARASAQAAIEAIPLGVAPESGEVRSLLLEAMPDVADLPDEARQALARDVAAFLAVRFGPDASAAGYAAWMRERGFEPADLGELRRSWFLDSAFESYGAGEYPEGASFDEVWGQIWTAVHVDPRVRVFEVSQVAATSAGYSVSIGTLTRADPTWPFGEGIPELAIGYAPTTHHSHSWWRHPRSWQAQLEETGRATVALVSMAIRVEDGRRGVLSINFVWDPGAGVWVHEGVSTDLPLRLEH